jgi:rare lipoprotein A
MTMLQVFFSDTRDMIMPIFTLLIILFNTQLMASTPTNTYTVFGKTYAVLTSGENYSETGVASWYGEDFHGNPTSSGTTYDMHKISVAHKTLPLGTWVKITNLDNGKQIKAEVIDRGPFVKNRLIDLSLAAAKKLDIIEPGTAKVHVESINTQNSINHVQSIQKLQMGAFKSLKNLKKMRHKITAEPSLNHLQFTIIKNNNVYKLIAKGPSNTINSLKSWSAKNHISFIEVKTGV